MAKRRILSLMPLLFVASISFNSGALAHAAQASDFVQVDARHDGEAEAADDQGVDARHDGEAEAADDRGVDARHDGEAEAADDQGMDG